MYQPAEPVRAACRRSASCRRRATTAEVTLTRQCHAGNSGCRMRRFCSSCRSTCRGPRCLAVHSAPSACGCLGRWLQTFVALRRPRVHHCSAHSWQHGRLYCGGTRALTSSSLARYLPAAVAAAQATSTAALQALSPFAQMCLVRDSQRCLFMHHQEGCIMQCTCAELACCEAAVLHTYN